jgi:hypothetical protein
LSFPPAPKPSVGINGEKVGLTPHPEIKQVLEALAVAATTSPSSLGEVSPPLKKVHTKGCLSPSSWYAPMGCCMLLTQLINPHA